MPNIEGEVELNNNAGLLYNNASATGAFTKISTPSTYIPLGTTQSDNYNLGLDASRSSKAYGSGGSHGVRPCAYGTLVCVYLGS